MRRVLFAILIVSMAGTAIMAQSYRTKADYRAGNAQAERIEPTLKDGSDTCVAPTEIAALPYEDNGDTTGAADTVSSIPGVCNGLYTTVAGPDHIYSFTVAGGNSLTFTTTTTDDIYDLSIYMLSTCGDGNTCVVGADACLARDNDNGSCPANDSTESFSASDLAPGTYYFYVDSFYGAAIDADRSSGPYTVTVAGDLPAELLDFEIE